MSFYGYDPAAFRNDFSWIGEAGNDLAKTVSAMPELMEYNKQVKTNMYFKQQSYEATYKWLDKLDSNKITNIASSMGIDYDPNDPEDARNKLKAMVPDPSQFSKKTSNEEYALKVANEFYNPVITAAMSQAGGGSLSFGELFAPLHSGTLQSAIQQTPGGKQLGEQDKFNTEMNRRYGEGGEEEVAFDKKNQMNDERSKQLMQPVMTAISTISDNYTKAVERPKALKYAMDYAKSMDFNEQQVSYLKNEVNSYFDDLLNNEKEKRAQDDNDTRFAIERERIRKENKQKELDKNDPVSKGTNIQGRIDDINSQIKNLTNKITTLSSEGKNNTVSPDEQKLIKKYQDNINWLNLELESMNSASQKFANSSAEGNNRLSDESRALASGIEGAQNQQNMKAIDDSRNIINKVNAGEVVGRDSDLKDTSYLRSDDKNEDRMNRALAYLDKFGSGYLYEKVKDPKTQQWKLELKPQYKQVGLDNYLKDSDPTLGKAKSDYESKMSMLKTMVRPEDFQKIKQNNPNRTDSEIWDAIYEKHYGSK